jgi:hypothetical protein
MVQLVHHRGTVAKLVPRLVRCAAQAAQAAEAAQAGIDGGGSGGSGDSGAAPMALQLAAGAVLFFSQLCTIPKVCFPARHRYLHFQNSA